MLPLSFLTLPLLCSLYSSAFSLQCNDKTQYGWPINNPRECCNKCPPGYYMSQDPDTSCNVKCLPCFGERYMETYNMKMHCNVCDSCSYPNMEHESNCSTTKNAVCRCKSGYRCNDDPCKFCKKISTTRAVPPSSLRPSTLSPSSLRPSTLPPPYIHLPLATELPSATKPISQDPMWFLVIIALLCAGIVILVAKKIRPLLDWIRSRHDFLPEKTAAQPLSSEDDVSKPVQEVSYECESTDSYVKV